MDYIRTTLELGLQLYFIVFTGLPLLFRGPHDTAKQLCKSSPHVRVSFYHFPMKLVGKKAIPSDKNKCSSLKFSRSDGLSTPQTTPVSFVELRLHSGC